jgi:hypothetical protein
MTKIRHRQTERGADLYETHPVAVRALMRAEALPKTLWEPACGPGAIVRVLREAGHVVLSTDLVDYKSPDQDFHGIDFTKPLDGIPPIDAIVMNPPFVHAMKFVELGLERAPKVYALLRLAFLESETRYSYFRAGYLHRVHVFSNRLPMMHRDGWEGPKASSTIAFAWFVFDRVPTNGPLLDWIKWEP